MTNPDDVIERVATKVGNAKRVGTVFVAGVTPDDLDTLLALAKPAPVGDDAGLILKLRLQEHRGRFEMGGGTITHDGKGTSWGGGKIMEYRNPDGPEAATRIQQLTAEVVRLTELLRPFALAADDLDDKHGDNSDIWEAPVALEITAGNLRAARAALAKPLPSSGDNK